MSRVPDKEVARVVARTPADECDASAYERLALDLREARAEIERLRATTYLRVKCRACGMDLDGSDLAVTAPAPARQEDQ